MERRHGPRTRPPPGRRARRQRHPPQGRPAAGRPARRPAVRAGGRTGAERARPGAGAGAGLRRDAEAPADLPGDRRARQRLRPGGTAALPRQRLSPARLDLDRLPGDPARGARLRAALAAARRPAPGRGASRARARHGRDRLGQDDHPGGDDRPHQPHPAAAHRDDRGSDRDRPRRPRLHRQPARGGPRHGLVRPGPPARPPPGPGRDPDRRAARRRDGGDGAARGRVGPPRALDDAHGRRLRDDRADDRVLPGGQAAADPLDPGRRPARGDQPAAAAAPRRRPHPGGRGDDQQRPDRRPDPREQAGRDRAGDRRGRLLPDADVQRRADPPRARQEGGARGGRERGQQPARLPDRPRAGPQGAGARGAAAAALQARARAGAGGGRRGRSRRRADRGRGGARRARAGARPARGGGRGARGARGAAEAPGRRPLVAMRRLVPLLGALLTLALASTAAADTFVVVRPHRAAGPSGGAIAFASDQPGPLSFSALRGIWQAAGAAYGIPWPVLAAINQVETNFGRNLGPSSAGAIGWMQFLPSTWARWGFDANGDGVADPNNPVDAIFSAARYLAACGGQVDIAAAVYCYNHSDAYVAEVLSLAARYATGAGAFVSFGDLQAQLAAARSEAASAGARLQAALRQARRLARVEQRWRRRASAAALVSDQLAAQKRAVLLGARRDALLARAARLRELVRAASARLGGVLDQENGFASGLGPALLAAPAAGLSSVQVGRIDQGVDLTSDGPFSALASGTVVAVDPNFWQGTPAVYEKLDAPITVGGRSYDEIYYAETEALVRVGQRLAAGEPVIAAGSAELGFARHGLPAAHGTYREGVPTQAGRDFYAYLTGSGASELLGGAGGYQPATGGTAFFSTGGAIPFTPDVVYFTR